MTFEDTKCLGLKEGDEIKCKPLRFENQGYLEQFEDESDEPFVQKTQVNEEISNEIVHMFSAEPINQNSHVDESINTNKHTRK